MNKKFKSQQALQVVLGSQTIKAFVAAPKEFKVLGIVRMGMEFGLLATTASGTYVRVNGSTVKALSTEAVEEAIKVARSSGRGESYAASRSHQAVSTAAPAVVVHKRRRHIEMPDINHAPAVNTPRHAAAA
jgi:dissimilatory sulfite reductase (desulfoviridin) alpha/beta subunit